MAEYIEREALLEAISKIGGSPLSEWDTVGMELFRATSCYPLDAPTGTAGGGMTTNA